MWTNPQKQQDRIQRACLVKHRKYYLYLLYMYSVILYYTLSLLSLNHTFFSWCYYLRFLQNNTEQITRRYEQVSNNVWPSTFILSAILCSLVGQGERRSQVRLFACVSVFFFITSQMLSHKNIFTWCSAYKKWISRVVLHCQTFLHTSF